MSRFLSREIAELQPYTPGEQPQNQPFNKLNTNESPFPPSPKVLKALTRAEELKLNLYSDPACGALCAAIARHCGSSPSRSSPATGPTSCSPSPSGPSAARTGARPSPTSPTAFTGSGPSTITSTPGSSLCGRTSPCGWTIIWISPGPSLSPTPTPPPAWPCPGATSSRLLEADPDRVVVVDEAYVDFGAESCVPLLFRYENLLVVQTFSKSRSLAGGRIGFALGSPALIADLNRVKYSFNPYNVNRLSIVAGAAAMEDEAYFRTCTAAIETNRGWTVRELENLGFTVLPSKANFPLCPFGRSPGASCIAG
jgi:histidinol-phosphate aminotransferase